MTSCGSRLFSPRMILFAFSYDGARFCKPFLINKITNNNNESVADEIFENSIANLFRETKDTIEIIKIKDILTVLESTMDSCEKVSNVLETILIKNS